MFVNSNSFCGNVKERQMETVIEHSNQINNASSQLSGANYVCEMNIFGVRQMI